MADYAIHDTTLIGTSNIIRKKEGSSALIDPADYPNRINLMGMLEKKIIVSSPICDFSDGSDDVPTDFVKITIPANLDGVSAVSEKQTGRNILDFTVRSQYGITTTKGADGGAIISGTASGGNVFVIDFVAMDLEAGKYNILVSGMATGMSASWTKNGAYGGGLNEGSNVITLSAKTTIGGYVRVTNGSSYPDPVTVYVQLTIGQDSETFEKYNPTTYSANLGRTIHGGEVDLVNGEGVDGYGTIVFDGSSDEYWRNYSNQNGFWIDIPTMQTGTNMQGASSAFDVGVEFSQFGIRLGANSVYAYFCHMTDNIEGVTDLESWKTWLSNNPVTLVYPLATPTDFTFDGQEIPTRLGYNCFISEQGDTSVAYRASGTVTRIAPALMSKTIEANGIYSASDDGVDGYDTVAVNVSSGTPFKYESVESSGLQSVFIAMEEGDYLCVLYCSYDGTRTFSTTGTLIFEEDINVSGDSRGIKVALCHLLPGQQISYQATTVNLYNSRFQAVIKLDDSISVSQMVDSYAINDGNTSGYTPSYSGNVLSVAVCGGNNTEHFYDKTIPRDSGIENSVNGGLNAILHIGYGSCPNYDMYGYYGNGVYIGLFQ